MKKWDLEDSDMTGEDGKPLISSVEKGDLEKEVFKWVNEVTEAMPKEELEEGLEEGWDVLRISSKSLPLKVPVAKTKRSNSLNMKTR